MKTLDRAYLAANPAGDEQATLTLSHPVPSMIELPDNPHGTRPKVTVHVTGDTYGQVLEGLSSIHGLGTDDLLNLLLSQVLEPEELEPFATMEEAEPLLRERISQVVVPFRTFEFTGHLNDTASDGTARPAPVVIAITAPSIGSAVAAAMNTTDPRLLANVAISLCPTVDDEDDGDEGLVVS